MENNDEYLGLSDAEIAALKESETEDGSDKDVAGEANDNSKAEANSDGMGEQEAPSEAEPFVPKFSGVDPVRLDELKTALDEAKEQFGEGELEYTAFDEIKDEYNEAKWKSDFAQQSNQDMSEARWVGEQERFLDENKQYRDNPTLNAAFVATVNNLIASEEGAKMSDRAVLLAAHQQMEADLQGLDSGGEASFVAGDNATHHAGEFAHLDKLEGADYQKAIDSLSPDQLARYEDLN